MNNKKNEGRIAAEKIIRMASEEGLSTYDLARKTGISQSTISGWSTGRNYPSLNALATVVSEGFDMTLSDFFLADGTEFEKKILIECRSLNNRQQKDVLIFIEFLKFLKNKKRRGGMF